MGREAKLDCSDTALKAASRWEQGGSEREEQAAGQIWAERGGEGGEGGVWCQSNRVKGV